MSELHDRDRRFLTELRELETHRLDAMLRFSCTAWRSMAIERELIRREKANERHGIDGAKVDRPDP